MPGDVHIRAREYARSNASAGWRVSKGMRSPFFTNTSSFCRRARHPSRRYRHQTLTFISPPRSSGKRGRGRKL